MSVCEPQHGLETDVAAFVAERVTDLFSDVDYSPMALAAQIYEIIFYAPSFWYSCSEWDFSFNDLPCLEIHLLSKSHPEREQAVLCSEVI